MTEGRKASRTSKSKPPPPPPLLAQGLDLPLNVYSLLYSFQEHTKTIDPYEEWSPKALSNFPTTISPYWLFKCPLFVSKTWPLYHNIESITQRKKERDQRRCPIRKEFIGTTFTDALGDSKSRPIVMKKKYQVNLLNRVSKWGWKELSQNTQTSTYG